MGKDNESESKFGFKDRAKAEETLKLLEEHDMQYRKLTVRGLLGRAKRVLTSKFKINTQWLVNYFFFKGNQKIYINVITTFRT